VKARQKIVGEEKQVLFDKICNDNFDTSLLLERDKEVRRMLHFNKLSSTEPFMKAYDKAIKHYHKTRNWQKAYKYFEKCLVMKPNDGPSAANCEFLRLNNNDSVACNYPGY